jgi:hypothetical protein
MNQFYLDAQRFDQWLTPNESEERVILSTWLNKQSIFRLGKIVTERLAKQIGDQKIESWQRYFSDQEKQDLSTRFAEDIFLLHALFSFCRTVAGITQPEYKKGLMSSIDLASLNRWQKYFFQDIFDTDTYLAISEALVARMRHTFIEPDITSQVNAKDVMLPAVWTMGYDFLTYLRAQVVTKHLLKIGWLPTSSTQTQANMILSIK